MQTNFSATQLADPAMAASEQVIRKCVHCGFCLATCPTYLLLGNELDSPRGRIYLMKDMLENERVPSPEVVKHVDRCLSCLSCVSTCPSGVNYMRLVDHARAYIESHHRRPWPQRLLRSVIAAILPYPGRFRIALLLARLGRPFGPILKRFSWGQQLAAMLDLASQPTGSVANASTAEQRPSMSRGRVVLLRGCVENILEPNIRAATVRLLQRAGYEVAEVAGESCCGALVHHMGREEEACHAARRNVDAWIAQLERGGLHAVTTTASGCGTTLKNYGFLLRDDPQYAEKAKRISALSKDISELLVEAGLPAPAKQMGLKVAYHSACSLQHGQAVREPPRQLLRAAGYDVHDIPEAHVCCGSAGTYNIMQPQIATQLRERKVANIRRVQPDVIAAGNVGCIRQIAAGTDIPIVHTVELLDWATGGPQPPSLQHLATRGSA